LKLEIKDNANYAAIIVEVKHLVTLEGLDNLVAVPMFGYQALVSKDTVLNERYVLLPTESQLSLEFAAYNNLHRHGDLNRDETATGYLEDNRRVRAIKLRGHNSNALLMPLESLLVFAKQSELDTLKAGDTFDTINGHEVCRKYLIREPRTNRAVDRNAVKKFRRVDQKFLPEHYDTENYWRNAHHIPSDAPVVVTQKLHGTSSRIGNTIVKRKLKWHERLAKRLGVKVAETEFDHVYGSRKVIKDANDPDQNHFYGSDLWSDFGKTLDDLIPPNFIVYGELIGWTPDGAPLQKGYTYDVPKGEARLYIYRVAVVTSGGLLIDLPWDQVKHFAADRGLRTVPELWRGPHGEFTADDWVDFRYSEFHGKTIEYEGADGAKVTFTFTDAPVPVSDAKSVDEGVCVRTDIGRAPYILKAKSPIFLAYETKMLDDGITDLESVGSEVDYAGAESE
jgi:hypothetical protein